MKNLYYILIFSCMFTFNTRAQEMNCNDSKTGVFIIPSDAKVPFSTRITRYENFQIEQTNDGKEKKINIEWLDDCSYLMKANQSEKNDSPSEKIVRKFGGIKVTLLEQKGDTIYFSANLLNATKATESKAYMIKIK